jgi:subtilase family serine protease
MHVRFGVTQEQFNAVDQWLEGQGFTITDKSYGGNEDYIRFKGTLAQVEKTFDVHIVLVAPDRFRNAQDPQIPQQFAGVIETITGFSGLMPM